MDEAIRCPGGWRPEPAGWVDVVPLRERPGDFHYEVLRVLAALWFLPSARSVQSAVNSGAWVPIPNFFDHGSRGFHGFQSSDTNRSRFVLARRRKTAKAEDRVTADDAKNAEVEESIIRGGHVSPFTLTARDRPAEPDAWRAGFGWSFLARFITRSTAAITAPMCSLTKRRREGKR